MKRTVSPAEDASRGKGQEKSIDPIRERLSTRDQKMSAHADSRTQDGNRGRIKGKTKSENRKGETALRTGYEEIEAKT